MEGTTGPVEQDTSVNRDVVTERLDRKPYFLTFFKDSFSRSDLDGIIQYDAASNSLSFKHLPSELMYTDNIDLSPHVVEGLTLCKHPENTNQCCVYSTHTRTNTPVPTPPAPQLNPHIRNPEFCGMMVDTSKEPNTFQLVVTNNIYESKSRHSSNSVTNIVFKRLFPSEPVWYFRMCHNGCMYKSTTKAVDGVMKYSVKDGKLTLMGGPMFRGEERVFLGAWDDHVLAVVHDSEAESVTVWKLIDTQTEFKWVKYASCPRGQYVQLMELPGDFGLWRPSNRPVLVSVFCEE